MVRSGNFRILILCLGAGYAGATENFGPIAPGLVAVATDDFDLNKIDSQCVALYLDKIEYEAQLSANAEKLKIFEAKEATAEVIKAKDDLRLHKFMTDAMLYDARENLENLHCEQSTEGKLASDLDAISSKMLDADSKAKMETASHGTSKQVLCVWLAFAQAPKDHRSQMTRSYLDRAGVDSSDSPPTREEINELFRDFDKMAVEEDIIIIAIKKLQKSKKCSQRESDFGEQIASLLN